MRWQTQRRWLLYWVVSYAPLAVIGLLLASWPTVFLAEVEIGVDWPFYVLWFVLGVVIPAFVVFLVASFLAASDLSRRGGR